METVFTWTCACVIISKSREKNKKMQKLRQIFQCGVSYICIDSQILSTEADIVGTLFGGI